MPSNRSALGLVLLAPLLLAACTVESNTTVSAERVATLAEDALEEQIGSRPDIDCGDEQVDLVDGTEVPCVLTDSASGATFETVVTISGVDGTNFSIDVQVADAPIDAGQGEEPSASDESSASDGALTVDNAELATLAAGALEEPLGFAVEVFCTDGETVVEVGRSLRCTVTGGDLEPATNTLITITEVDGTAYSINAVIE